MRAPVVLTALVFVGAPAWCQSTTAHAPSSWFRVMGQPPALKPYVVGSFTLLEPTGAARAGATLSLGAYKDLADPLEGLLGLAAEGYVAGFDSAVGGGARLLAGFPLVFLQLGLDYNWQQVRVAS